MTPHHVRETSELEVTVSFTGETSAEEQADVLNELMLALKDGMGLNERLTRTPGMGQHVGPLRVFVLEFQDPDRCSSALRSVGGWYMRHPGLTVSFKAEGPRGGIRLQLKGFSTVAFARAGAKISDLMTDEEP